MKSFGEFISRFLDCNAHFKSELRWNGERDQDNLQMKFLALNVNLAV